MLISGYFLVEKSFKVKTIVRLYGQVWFYSVLSGVLAYLLTPDTLAVRDIVSILMPFMHNEYWYFTTYIIVYLMFPYLNVIIERLGRVQHQFLIIIGAAIVSILHFFVDVRWILFDNSLPVFIVMYFVGAYIKKFDVSLPRKRATFYSILLIAVGLVSVFGMRMLQPASESFKDITYFVYDSSKLLPMVTSCILLLLFKDIKLEGAVVKTVSFLSSSVFGVYLFHVGRLNKFIFMRCFNDTEAYETPFFPVYLMVAGLSIFAAGILVDKFRIYLIERFIIRLGDSPIRKIDKKIAPLYPSPELK